MAPLTVAALALAPILFGTLNVLYRLFFHPLRKVPGPRAAAVTGLWRTSKYIKGQWHDDIVKLHAQYGPVVRIAPNEISFVDEEALKTLYGHGSPSIKTSWYDTWTFKNNPSTFSVIDPSHHRMLRSRASAIYSMSSVLHMEPMMSQILQTTMKQFQKMATDGEPVDLVKWLNLYAYDTVGFMGLGSPFGFTENGRDDIGLIAPVHDVFSISPNVGHLPGQNVMIDNVLLDTLSKLFPKLNAIAGAFEYSTQKIRERQSQRGNGQERNDMLQFFVEMRNKDGSLVGENDIMNEFMSLIAAGTDTSAGGIMSTLHELMIRPSLYKQVKNEVTAAHKALGLGVSQDMSYLEVSKLPLLKAVIQETLRLTPPIPYQLPRETPPNGMSIRGHYIPQGTTVGMSPGAMNRSKAIFGNDADEFRHERWLHPGAGDKEEHIKAMEAKLTTFGMGSRVCSGRNIATVELHTVVAAIVRRFDMRLVDPAVPWELFTHWFSQPRDFKVFLTPTE